MKVLFFRKKLDMSQVELAERAGVTQSAVSKYENGDVLPSVPVLQKLASALCVSVDALLEDEVKTS